VYGAACGIFATGWIARTAQEKILAGLVGGGYAVVAVIDELILHSNTQISS